MTFIVNFDRFLMGFTLASHILIVTMSIGLSIIVSLAEYIGIRRKDPYYEALARRLTIALVIFFAIGTASGTVLAVELFALWPSFMVVVGKVDILPFYYEVFAFLLESICLVLYFYYWDFYKNRYKHWVLSLMVAVGTVMSAVFITMINAWMNTPAGFNIPYYLKTGILTDINPLAAIAAPSVLYEDLHVVTATVTAGVFLIGAYLAYSFLRAKSEDERIFNRKGLKLVAAVGLISIALAGITGSLAASQLIVLQPLKYAAIELDLHSKTSGAETLGGILVSGKILYAITIPKLQSLLAYPQTLGKGTLPGLDQYPQSLWPPLFIHLTFDTMVGGGFLVGLFALYLIWRLLRQKSITTKIGLYGMIVSGLLLILVYDSGWVTDEVGRQPWIIYNVMTVQSAANTSSAIIPLGIAIMIFYFLVVPFSFYFVSRVLRHESVQSEIDKARGLK